MCKVIILLISVAFTDFQCIAQDIIFKVDGSEIKSKIVEITDDYVKYKNFEQPDGPIRNILKNDIFLIIYSDGTKKNLKERNLIL